MTRVGNLESKSLADCTNNVIKEDVIVPSGESVDIDVRVWLDSSAPTSELDKGSYPKLSIDGLIPYNGEEEIDNSDLSLTYMKWSAVDFYNPTHHRVSTYREYIVNASFVDYIDTTNASLDSENNPIIWDMSEDTKLGSVMMWLEDNETTDDSGNKYYDLYVGCNYKIYSTNLVAFFAGMTNLKSINFENLDTGLVTKMAYMFQKCIKITNIDVSNWNTSRVTNITQMFYNCSSLTNIDVSNWDTSKVTNMRAMFRYCYKLTTTITIRNINCTNYEHIFNNAATAEGAQITVNYIGDDAKTTDVNESTESLVESMIATKSSSSNVVKGTLVS